MADADSDRVIGGDKTQVVMNHDHPWSAMWLQHTKRRSDTAQHEWEHCREGLYLSTL